MLNFSITLILFSLLEVSSKPLMFFTDAVALTFYRFFLGLLTLLAFARHKKILGGIKKIPAGDLWLMAFLGILNTGLAMSFLQLAVKYSNAATAAVIFCSNPFFVFIFSIISGAEKFNLRCFGGVVTGIGGVALVMARHGFHVGAGALFAVLASMMFAVYIIMNKNAAGKCDPVNLNIVSFFAGLVFTAAYIGFSGRSFVPPPALYGSAGNISIMLFLGVAVSGFGYITFINTIKKYSPISASVIFLLKPALATLFAIALLGERPDWMFYCGLFMVMIGSWLILSSKYHRMGH